MPRRRIPESLKLLHRVQSTRLSLAKRLNALAQLAQTLDSCLCRDNSSPATGATALSAQDALQLLETINEVVRTQLLPLLAKRHLPISTIAQLNEEQRAWLAQDFQRSI
ncbi:MAG: hypothetical protein KDE19_10405, partial [Caldilineaceae bacterium]|nr:hypothetical protein [Caldilineaceae bacterium]